MHNRVGSRRNGQRDCVMGKYRKVTTQLWGDDRFRALTDDSKLLFVYLLTHPSLTPFGVLPASMDDLANGLSWDAERITKAFREIPKSMAERDEVDSCVFLPNYLRHNPPANPKQIGGWKSVLLIRACPIRDKAVRAMKKCLNGHAKWRRVLESAPWYKTLTHEMKPPEPEKPKEKQKRKEEPPERHIEPPRPVQEELIPISPTGQEFQNAWNAMASTTNGTISQIRMTEPRRQLLYTRRKDAWWAQNWKLAIDMIPSCRFLMGSSDSGWVASATWFLKRPDAATNILEGVYKHGKRKKSNVTETRSEKLDNDESLF